MLNGEVYVHTKTIIFELLTKIVDCNDQSPVNLIKRSSFVHQCIYFRDLFQQEQRLSELVFLEAHNWYEFAWTQKQICNSNK